VGVCGSRHRGNDHPGTSEDMGCLLSIIIGSMPFLWLAKLSKLETRSRTGFREVMRLWPTSFAGRCLLPFSA